MSVKVKNGATGGAGGEGNTQQDPKLKASGAADGEGGDEGGDEGDDGDAGEGNTRQDATPRNKKVDWSDHKRALDDLNKIKKQNQKLLDDAKLAKTKELESQNRYKELYESAQRERDEAKTEAQKIKDSFVEREKYSAVKTAAVQAGLKPEAIDDLESIELDLVEVETTNKGRMNVLGVNEQINKLKSAKPHWFGGKAAPRTASGNPRVNAEGGEGDGAVPSMSEVRALEKKAKSGKAEDKQAYYDAMNRFRNKHARKLEKGALR